MQDAIKKISSQWAKELGYQILDPDGWDRINFDYSFNKEKITLQEFQKRLSVSTFQTTFKDKLFGRSITKTRYTNNGNK